MSRFRFALAGALAALVATAPAPRAQSFQGLGDLPGGSTSSNAFEVSDDGTVVIGSSQTADGGRAYRWTAQGGMVDLGTIGGFEGSSYGYGLSGDGGTVVGQSPWGTGPRGFRWTAGEGMLVLLGVPNFPIRADAASANGSVIVGRGSFGATTEAFRWTQGGNAVGLGDLPGGSTASYAIDVSADGNIVVGYSSGANGTEAFRWAGSMVGIGDLPGGGFSSVAWGISAGGGLIVGGSSSADLPSGQAFIWSQAEGGMDALDFIEGAIQTTAYAVSDDGQRIVGYVSLSGGGGIRATIWDGDGNIRLLQDVLVSDYGLNLDGWTLQYAEAITPDGRVVVGSGTNPNGNPEAWIAELGPPVENDIVITDTRDLADPDLDDDRCDVDPVAVELQCTLRAAIETANAREGRDSVSVNIEGAGVHTITIGALLPAIEEPMILDARTQPGYTGTPLVVLTGTVPTGLLLTGGESTVRGLAVGGFSQAGISITGPGENRVEACHLGVDPSGTAAFPNTVGVLVTDSPDNVIGGAAAARRNLISGNTEAGVRIVGPATTGTVVAGNRIGLNVDGTAVLPNVAAGVELVGAPGVRVGGPAVADRNVIAGGAVGVEVRGAAAGSTVQGNYFGLAPDGQSARPLAVGVRARGATGLVVGAAGAPNRFLTTTTGVFVTANDEGGRSSSVRIEGNVFGLLVTGAAPPGAPAGSGVVVERADGTVVGGAATTTGAAPGNRFGRLNAAVRVFGTAAGSAAGTRIAGNLIGLDSTGTEARLNSVGVWVQGAATGTRVGGWAAGERNVIAGNGTGVAVTNGDGSTTAGEPTGTVVAGNYIGTTPTGQRGLGHTEAGVYVGPGSGVGAGGPVGGPADVTIGATAAMSGGAPANLRRNVILGSPQSNVVIDRTGAVPTGAVRVVGNYVGLDASGQGGIDLSTFPTATRVGIRVRGNARAVVGGGEGDANVIGGHIIGVWLEGDEGVVVGNRIGTDPTGTQRRANAHGVAVSGARNRVGLMPDGTPLGNVVSGNILAGTSTGVNDGIGVWIASADLVQVVVSGSQARGAEAGAAGLAFPGPDAVPTAARAVDVPAAHRGALAIDNVVAFNLMGTTAAGDAAVVPTAQHNRSAAVWVSGGSAGTQLYGNTISGTRYGVVVSTPSNIGNPVFPTGTRIAGNRIGLRASGGETDFVPNSLVGLYVTGATDVVVGDGAVAGQGPNRIAGTGTDGSGLPPTDFAPGVFLPHPSGAPTGWPTVGPTLRRNFIYGNEGLAVSRDVDHFGVTANGPENTDGSASFDFPVLYQAVDDGTALTVTGVTNGPMTVEVYADEPCDALGHGEGRRYLGALQSTPEGAFAGTVDRLPFITWRVSVIGTNANGTTSEYSPCVGAAVSGDAASFAVGAGQTPAVEGPGVNVTVTANRPGAALAAGTLGADASLRGDAARAAGTLYLARHRNPADDGAFEGSAVSADGTTIRPNAVQRQSYWSVLAAGLDGITYEACLRYDGLWNLPVPGQIVVVTRGTRASPWAPHATTLRSSGGGSYVCAGGLSSFGEVAVGVDSLVNPVPVEEGPETGPAEAAPTAFALSAARPNPSSGTAALDVAVPTAGRVRVEAYDGLGRRVAVLLDGERAPGRYPVTFDAAGLPSGVYVVRAMGGGEVAVQRLTVVR